MQGAACRKLKPADYPASLLRLHPRQTERLHASSHPCTVADVAYSYTFTLERLKADGTKDTLSNLVVYHKNSAGQDTRQLQQARKEFELTIPSSSLGGAGRCAEDALHG